MFLHLCGPTVSRLLNLSFWSLDRATWLKQRRTRLVCLLHRNIRNGAETQWHELIFKGPKNILRSVSHIDLQGFNPKRYGEIVRLGEIYPATEPCLEMHVRIRAITVCHTGIYLVCDEPLNELSQSSIFCPSI